MEAYFTEFTDATNWVKGKCGRYSFDAKLFNEGSCFGINEGRVSKLTIYDNNHNWVVNYDRGWDIEPSEDEHVEIFESVMELLENSPERDFN